MDRLLAKIGIEDNIVFRHREAEHTLRDTDDRRIGVILHAFGLNGPLAGLPICLVQFVKTVVVRTLLRLKLVDGALRIVIAETYEVKPTS